MLRMLIFRVCLAIQCGVICTTGAQVRTKTSGFLDNSAPLDRLMNGQPKVPCGLRPRANLSCDCMWCMYLGRSGGPGVDRLYWPAAACGCM
ncbi:hypothetical protein BDW75DRAFT_182913 [Aspergillus navahoensis]